MIFDASFFAGIVTWGVVREVVAFFYKEWIGKKKARCKLLSDEAAALSSRIEKIVKAATTYYSEAGNWNSSLSSEIKIGIREFAEGWGRLAKTISDIDGYRLESSAVISFRQAVTWDLDVSARPAWGIGSPGLEKILESSSRLRDCLSDIRVHLAR
jgi:hypothetical protein